jgi:proteic killer suppression protein
MIISFQNPDLEQLCTQQREATKRLGAPGFRKLRARLADLDAAETVRDLTTGRPHPLKGDRAGQFAVDLVGGLRLVFRPTEDPPPLDANEATDWSQVRSICIVFIGDYHD